MPKTNTFISSSSDSEDEYKFNNFKQHSYKQRKNYFKPNELKEQKLILVSNLKYPTKIEIGNKIISPFKNMVDLSFAQRDKYIYELGWFLKKNYGNTFKHDWCSYRFETKKHIKKYMNIEDGWGTIEEDWDTIDPNNLFQDDFDLETHEFILKVMSKVFSKFKQLFNEYKPFYEIKNKIKYFTSCYTIYDLIEDDVKNKFFVNDNDTSYIYNEETKLYEFNSTLEKTLKTLNSYLNIVKEKIEKLLFFISNEYNSLILNSFISNINSYTTQKKILDIIKKDNKKIIFNNNKIGEISFDKYVLNFKTQEIKERTHFNYYTTNVNANYLKNYNHVPEYIKSVFGKNKDILKQIQILLGSLITGCEQDKFVLFYGTGANSKSKLLYTLKEILNGFQFNIDYEQYNKEKNSDELINKLGFEQKRIIAIDDIDYKTFLKDESRFRRLLTNNKFNFIGTTNVKPIVSDNIAMKRRLIILNFENVFVETPEKSNEKQVIRDLNINYDFLFTWLVKGAIAYMETYKECKEISKIEIEAKREYGLDQIFDTESENESEDELESEIGTTFISPEKKIIIFVKNHIVESPNGIINKKTLYEMYCNENKDSGIVYKEFNKIIRNKLNFQEKRSHNDYYWIGYSLL